MVVEIERCEKGDGKVDNGLLTCGEEEGKRGKKKNFFFFSFFFFCCCHRGKGELRFTGACFFCDFLLAPTKRVKSRVASLGFLD